jgi:hypothetical protein
METVMSHLSSLIKNPFIRFGFASMVIGALLLFLPTMAAAQYQFYEGPEFCKQCHEDNYNEWKASGHPYKLMKGEEAQFRPIPLPKGFDWEDISYVIGGYKWKSRYMDKDGYIITNDGSLEGTSRMAPSLMIAGPATPRPGFRTRIRKT